MNDTITLALIGAVSPIALLIVGFWLKRSAEDRTQLLLAATAGNRLIAERNAETASQNLAKSITIEQKVDGTLSQAVKDLATAREEINELTTSFAVFQQKVDSYLRTGAGGAALQDAIPKS